MPHATPISPFPILTDPEVDNHALPAFMVSTTRGFLPRQEPIDQLPSDFDALTSILERMPVKTIDGEPGLLATFEIGKTVDAELPDLSPAIEKHKDDLLLMNALYRDYAFLASANLLEPCHENHVSGRDYGLGRGRLPKNIALPIVKVSEIAGFKPFMEYAGSYALYNYRLEDPSKGLEYDNMRLIRAFEHGLDPKSSEAGFVLVHVAMVKHSGALITAAVDVLKACEKRDRSEFNAAMDKLIDAMLDVNKVMNIMWAKSKPHEYTNYRTFIFGITGQSFFPNGVIYEGVSEEPMHFRGESGANDSMIPLCDNLLQISMPDTPLTEILNDFRNYRPGNHRTFLEYVAATSGTLELKNFALEDPTSSALYLRSLDQVRDFRWRHWCFTKEYILRRTKYARATGGSPIVTWLPNQLEAVLKQMGEVEPYCGDDKQCKQIMREVREQHDTLTSEVAKYRKERPDGAE